LYRKTDRDFKATDKDSEELTAIELAEPLSEFVLSSLNFHISACPEDAVTTNAISRTFLLLHLLLQDSAGNSSLWPITTREAFTGVTGTHVTPKTFTDIEARLDPSKAGAGRGEVGGAGSFDAAFCHLRRVLFWLEITCSSNLAEERMDDLFKGLTAYRDDQVYSTLSTEHSNYSLCPSFDNSPRPLQEDMLLLFTWSIISDYAVRPLQTDIYSLGLFARAGRHNICDIIYIRIRIHLHMHLHIHIHVHIHVQTHMHVHIHIHTQIHVQIHIQIRIQIHVHIHIHTLVRACVRAYLCM
jgi:hypothetical protein